jgi:serine/threonine protein kinase
MFKLPDQPVNHLTKHLGAAAGGSASALGLLQALLTWDPDRRISAEDALDHPFFKVPVYSSSDAYAIYRVDRQR